LPAGWRSIEIDRIWIRGQAWRLLAVQGEPRARLEPIGRTNPLTEIQPYSQQAGVGNPPASTQSPRSSSPPR
jgi:hypothetical protein